MNANDTKTATPAILPILLFNTTICPSYPARYSLGSPITPAEARALVNGRETVSAIGHQATADAMAEILGRPVAVCRTAGGVEPGQQVLVLKLRGRLPEGVILTGEQLEAIGYDLLVMTRLPDAADSAIIDAKARQLWAAYQSVPGSDVAPWFATWAEVLQHPDRLEAWRTVARVALAP